MNSELEARPNLRQRLLGALTASQGIRDDPDMMAAVDLAVGEIQDVAEDSADRRAHRVQDPKRLVLVSALRRRHDQNLRPSANPRSPRDTIATGASACTRQSAANGVHQQEKASRAPRIEQPFGNLRFRFRAFMVNKTSSSCSPG